MRVLEVSNEKVRTLIDQFSERCGQDRLKFARDGLGRYVIGLQNLDNPKFTFQKTAKTETTSKLQTDLKTEVRKEPTLTVKDSDYQSISDLLRIYGTEIEHVPQVEQVEEPPNEGGTKTTTTGTK